MASSTTSGLDKQTQPVLSCPSPVTPIPTCPDVCAKFITTTPDGRTQSILTCYNVVLTKTPQSTFTQCRKTHSHRQKSRYMVAFSLALAHNMHISTSRSSYVIPDIVVSSLHCKIYAVRTSAGGILISCQDLSTNGVIINGHKIRKTCAVVTHGDTIKVPASQTFQCVQKWRHLPTKHLSKLSQPQSAKNVGRYLITSHCLGTGSYATVHLALDTFAHRQVACKIIRRKEGTDIKKEMKEATLLMALHHPNINRVYAVDADPEFLYIMLQLSTGGDLFTYITTHTRHHLCEGEAKYITFQLLKGLKYLHDRMISHRDLKVRLLCFPTNFPFTSASSPKISFSIPQVRIHASRLPTSVLHARRHIRKHCMSVVQFPTYPPRACVRWTVVS